MALDHQSDEQMCPRFFVEPEFRGRALEMHSHYHQHSLADEIYVPSAVWLLALPGVDEGVLPVPACAGPHPARQHFDERNRL